MFRLMLYQTHWKVNKIFHAPGIFFESANITDLGAKPVMLVTLMPIPQRLVESFVKASTFLTEV